MFIQNQRHTERGTETLSYQDGRTNLIAFSRGAKGWLAINNSVASSTRTFQTGIAPGTYCDIINGSYRRGACTGPKVVVRSNGAATVMVAGKDSVAFDTRYRLR